MVSTRGHPRNFPEPGQSPSKSTRARTRSPVKSAKRVSTSPEPEASPSNRAHRTRSILVPVIPVASRDENESPVAAAGTRSTRSYGSTAGWLHTPSLFVLVWLAISVPLVIWDTGYVFGRPHTMAGGKFVSPLYNPYLLYAKIDYVYGKKSWKDRNGFTAAQSFMNVIETVGYLVYLGLVYAYSKDEPIIGRGAPSQGIVGRLAYSRTLRGRIAAWAVLLAFGTSVMTLSKTILYMANEAFSGFSNIAHNDRSTLFFLYMLPNGSWIVFPAYMTFVFGAEILQGLKIAAGPPRKLD